jgi:hypothetical protein
MTIGHVPEWADVESQPPAHWFLQNPDVKPPVTLPYAPKIDYLRLGRFILDNLGVEALTLDRTLPAV